MHLLPNEPQGDRVTDRPRTHRLGCSLRTGVFTFKAHRPPPICDCGLWEEEGDPRAKREDKEDA